VKCLGRTETIGVRITKPRSKKEKFQKTMRDQTKPAENLIVTSKGNYVCRGGREKTCEEGPDRMYKGCGSETH